MDSLTPNPEEILEQEPSRLDEYFANKPEDEITSALSKKTEDYYRYLRSSGRLGKMEKSYRTYFGQDERGFDSAYINRSGSEGELHTMRVNHYRSLNQSLLTLTTSQPPTYEVRANNTDYRSQTQSILGSALLDYYVKEKTLGKVLKDCCEYSLYQNEGFIYAPWNREIGEDYAPDMDQQRMVRKGDIEYTAKAPIDVIRDPRLRDSKFPWCIVRSWVNRYDLAAESPHLTDEILNVGNKSSEETSFLIDLHRGSEDTDTDLVPVFEFYHEKTSAVPKGRYVKYIGDIVLEYSTLEDLEYEGIPVFRMAANEATFTPFGYSNTTDLLGIQEAVDTLYSTILTNQSTFGVQYIWKKKGGAWSVEDLSGGLTLIQSDEEPKPLNLTQTPPEIFNFIKQLEGVMELISGINSTVRGDPQSSLKSGAALALVASQAVQFASNIASAYEQCFESVGSWTFKVLQKKAVVPRLIAIVGQFNRSYLDQFTAQDIDQISRVVIDRGNPLTKTAAGRIELANTLLQNQLVKTAEEYLMVLQTGRLEPMIEGTTAELLNIRAENEALRKGQQISAIRVDNHDLHIAEHAVIISSPEARRNGQLVQDTLDHIADHENQKIVQAQHQQQLQMQLQGPPPPQQQAPNPQGPGSKPAGPGAVMAQNPVTQAQSVNMPRMPTDPHTGQPYKPAV